MAARTSGEVGDYRALRSKLVAAVAALSDPEAKGSGSDVASLGRARRIIGKSAATNRLRDLRGDYRLLGKALPLASGSGAAAIAQERRMMRRDIDVLASSTEGTAHVDQLDSWRRSRSATSGAASRRRQSG